MALEGVVNSLQRLLRMLMSHSIPLLPWAPFSLGASLSACFPRQIIPLMLVQHGQQQTRIASDTPPRHYRLLAIHRFILVSIRCGQYERNAVLIMLLFHRALNIHPGAGAFVITAGAILGLCAGLLWTAQGSLMLAYATENQKGVFIGIFWAIFNLGAVVGASVSLSENIENKVRVRNQLLSHL